MSLWNKISLNSYPNVAYDTWLIAAPTGSIIYLQFHSFHVGHLEEFENITINDFRFIFVSQTQDPIMIDGTLYHGDPLTIYDGSNEQSYQIVKLSGNLGSFSISSTGNSLFIKFESDNLDNFAGFIATIHYSNPWILDNNKRHLPLSASK